MKGKTVRWGILCLSLVVLAMPSTAAAPPSWVPAVTSDFMTIYGDATQGAALTLNGSAVTKASASVLAAFAPGVTNAVGNYLMGSQPPALNDGEFLMTIYGNDASSGKNGAAAGDNVAFKLYYAPTGRIYSGYTVFDNDASVPRVLYASFFTDPILQPHLVTLHFRNQAPVIAVDNGVTRLNYAPSDNLVKGIVYRLSDPDTGDFVVVDNVIFRPAIDNASWVGVFVDGVQWDNVLRATDNSATWFQLGTGGGAFADNVAVLVKGPVSSKDTKIFTITLMVSDDVGAPTPVTSIPFQDNTVSISVGSSTTSDDENWFKKAFGCAVVPAGAPVDEPSNAATLLVMVLPAVVILLRRKR
jgi:hypothetical protein